MKRASVPPQLVCLHGFYMDGIKLYDTWMINGTSQCLHRKSTPCLVIILHFYLFVNKLNVRKHMVKVFNPHFANFAMSTLPTWTIQSRHNGACPWPLVLVLGLSLPSTPFPPMKATCFTLGKNYGPTHPPFHLLMQQTNFDGGIFQWVNCWHLLDQVESSIP